MGLKDDLLTLSLEDRLTYDPVENIFYVNFEGYFVKTSEDVQEIKSLVEKTRRTVLFWHNTVYHQYLSVHEDRRSPCKT